MLETVKDTNKTEFSKESIKDRWSLETISKKWVIVKDIAGVVWGVSSTAQALIQLGAFTVNPVVSTILGGVVTVSLIIYGRGRLDKSKK